MVEKRSQQDETKDVGSSSPKMEDAQEGGWGLKGVLYEKGRAQGAVQRCVVVIKLCLCFLHHWHGL